MIFDPHYDFNYHGMRVRIFEIVRKFEGKTPKIITLKLYIDGNYQKEKTFYNSNTEYQRQYRKLMQCLVGRVLGSVGSEKKKIKKIMMEDRKEKNKIIHIRI